jgi:polar amino acid transport system substrate-binding protein
MVTTDVTEVLRDPGTDAVIISSSQPNHFRHLCQAVEAGKAIYLEKPLVTRLDHFREVMRLMDDEPVLLTLGLNRRYSPMVAKLRDALHGPVHSVTYTIAERFIPPDHWSLDEVDGGGRLVSEGEHFIDLCHLLIDREPLSVFARPLGPTPDDLRKLCNFAVTIHYDGAVANVVFTESGGDGFPRERLQVLSAGQVAVLDDFGKLTLHGKKRRSYGSASRRQMGHKQALEQFVTAVRGEPNRVPTWRETSTASLCMFAAQESMRTGEPIFLQEFQRHLLQGETE